MNLFQNVIGPMSHGLNDQCGHRMCEGAGLDGNSLQQDYSVYLDKLNF
jgi:hypothetical protein